MHSVLIWYVLSVNGVDLPRDTTFSWHGLKLSLSGFFSLFFMIEITNNLIHQVHVTHNDCNSSMIYNVNMSLKLDSFEKASTTGLNFGTS